MDTETRTDHRIEGFVDGRWHLLRPVMTGSPEKNLTEVMEVLRTSGMARYTKVRIRRSEITESTTAEVTI